MMTHGSSVRVSANIPRKGKVEEVDHAEVAEKLHKARSFTLIHTRQGPVHLDLRSYDQNQLQIGTLSLRMRRSKRRDCR